MKGKSSDFFWPSFTDLMTSLFFIMLLLYVLTFVKLKIQQRATEEQLNKILEIQNAVKELDSNYFEYDSTYKRFSLKRNIEFVTKESNFKHEEDKIYLLEVGWSIQKLINRLKEKYAGQDIKYVLIIEGMASKDGYIENFPLSYKRSWEVVKLWEKVNILLDPSVCEIQISGSGTGGIGRFPKSEEVQNQRILIQIVPKIGEIITK